MSKGKRKANYPILPIILNRWSPRAMSGKPMSDKELFPLFEASRWAPSSYNDQPWRFLYAKRDSKHWKTFLELLNEFNQSWAKNASCLVVVISKKTFDYNNKPARTHSFDTGAAWMNLALEAFHKGYVTHGMEGFDYAQAQKKLKIPKNHQVEAMIAIGKKAPQKSLSPELQKKEVPSKRRPLSEIMIEGPFK